MLIRRIRSTRTASISSWLTRQRKKHPQPTRRFSSRNDPLPLPSATSTTTTWERGAVAVKNTNVTNPYLDAIRKTHDPVQHVKTIEDELKGTIGKALGKQGDKVLRAVRGMEAEFQTYQDILRQQDQPHDNEKNSSLLQESAIRYNGFREEALKARWELTVHRQAAGFIVDNHGYVTRAYPIADALPVTTGREENSEEAATKKKKRRFTDQLDWWQKIGRWR